MVSNSNNAQFHIDIGDDFYKAGEFCKAICAYDRAWQINSNNIFILIKRAAVYNAVNDTDKEIEDYNRILASDTTNTDIRNKRGMALKKKCKVEEAIKDFTEVLRSSPEDPDAIYNLQIFKDEYLSYINKGDDFYKNGHFVEARATYHQAVRIAPNDPDALRKHAAANEEVRKSSESFRMNFLQSGKKRPRPTEIQEEQCKYPK